MPVGTYLSVDMKSFVLHLYISEVVIQGLFGVLLFVYVPNLDPYSGYTPLRDDVIENTEYEELPGTEQICPERELGVASIVGAVLLVFLFPLQTYIISKMQKLSKEGLQRTNKRIGLMNEILAAMDTSQVN